MRVAIVNDQQVAAEALRRIVLSDNRHQVAWTAADGREAVLRCQRDLPDVVLMDLVMPVMNGAEATREIMRSAPCPVLVVTATVAGNYALVCEALGHGAFDAVCTPVLGDRPPREAGAQLLAKLQTVRDVTAAPPRSALALESPALGRPAAVPPPRDRPPLVALGASTGGPQALECILAGWPADFPAAVVVVQHIARDFAPSLTQWLQQRAPLSVRVAREGERPTRGVALVAATDDHLVLRGDGTLGYTAQPRDNPFRPSVDVLFRSLAEHWTGPSVAALLTGIGRDGAAGLRLLRERGWHTIAQDRGTSVVYGMPQAAAELGAAVRTLPLPEIAPHILAHLGRLA